MKVLKAGNPIKVVCLAILSDPLKKYCGYFFKNPHWIKLIYFQQHCGSNSCETNSYSCEHAERCRNSSPRFLSPFTLKEAEHSPKSGVKNNSPQASESSPGELHSKSPTCTLDSSNRGGLTSRLSRESENWSKHPAWGQPESLTPPKFCKKSAFVSGLLTSNKCPCVCLLSEPNSLKFL